MVEQQVRNTTIIGSAKGICERKGKAYKKTNMRMTIEHPHVSFLRN
jgi:hypothetical protein